jgi:23S rRNA (uracil1939-C5)-methyltransferase
VLVRATTTGQAHVVLVARRTFAATTIVDDLHDAGATTISINENIGELSCLLGPMTRIVSGPAHVEERIAGLTFPISPDSFFQTSPQAAGHLVRLVCEWLAPRGSDDVADLYCGGGLLTLPLARTARSAFGIELSRTAIGDANAAARRNRITNAQWRSGHVHAWLRKCGRDLPRPHLAAMDPPRTGLDPDTIAELARLRPRRLAYVSCEPRALQRDLLALRDAGFRTARITLVDMFPQTSHIEAVACLEAG